MSNALAKVGSAGNLKGFLEKKGVEIGDMLPKHVNPATFQKSVLMAVHNTPGLLDCTVESVMACVLKGASLGLDMSGGTLGHAYMIPYGKQATLIPGYRGLLDLIRRGGSVRSVSAQVVYENDTFVYQQGTSPDIKHVPSLTDRGDIIAFYAVAFLNDGGRVLEVMTKADVDAVRKASKAGNSGPWVTNYPQMGRKTVIRRIFNYLPVSLELLQQIQTLDDEEFGNAVQVQAVSVVPTGKQKVRSRAQVEAAVEEQDVVETEAEPVEEPGEATDEQILEAFRSYARTLASENGTTPEEEEAGLCAFKVGDKNIKAPSLAYFAEKGKMDLLRARAEALSADPRFAL